MPASPRGMSRIHTATCTTIVSGAFSEEYRVEIRAHSTATLPILAFQGATKRNRPRLVPGDVVYARVVDSSLDIEPSISCVDAQGQASGLGVLQGGYVFTSTTGHARRLLHDPAPLELQLLAKSFQFELAVGANGRIWVQAPTPKVTATLVQCLLHCASLHNAEEIREFVNSQVQRTDTA
eukprot:TRINITY_DN8008_c0_g1_i1.p3 TRINITY_DN8008_c0_g1~~TRINITY_DN8008_c0_g1_i1.p3  ORF type:complete len:180 (-),score=2.44 TRINITY_DN8008_c0_g1_i1:187-726(-)